MKRTLLVLLALMVCSTSAFGLVSTAEIFKRIVITVGKLESMGCQILFAQLDNIKRNYVDTQTYALQSGSSYSIVAIGDEERVQDIDLKVLDENNNVVGKDDDSENIAMVQVSPRRSGKFKIIVSGYEMNRSDAFYGIIIARND